MGKNDPHKAAKALLLARDKYLLLLRSPKEVICPSEWDIPGGGIEPEETEKEALIREVKEEVGIDISSCKIFPIKKWEKVKEGKIKISGIDFLCILKDQLRISLSVEHVRSKWFTEEEIIKGKEFPDWIKETIKLIPKETKLWKKKKLKSKKRLIKS